MSQIPKRVLSKAVEMGAHYAFGGSKIAPEHLKDAFGFESKYDEAGRMVVSIQEGTHDPSLPNEIVFWKSGDGSPTAQIRYSPAVDDGILDSARLNAVDYLTTPETKYPSGRMGIIAGTRKETVQLKARKDWQGQHPYGFIDITYGQLSGGRGSAITLTDITETAKRTLPELGSDPVHFAQAVYRTAKKPQ